jgi:hypothetical protein
MCLEQNVMLISLHWLTVLVREEINENTRLGLVVG